MSTTSFFAPPTGTLRWPRPGRHFPFSGLYKVEVHARWRMGLGALAVCVCLCTLRPSLDAAFRSMCVPRSAWRVRTLASGLHMQSGQEGKVLLFLGRSPDLPALTVRIGQRERDTTSETKIWIRCSAGLRVCDLVSATFPRTRPFVS